MAREYSMGYFSGGNGAVTGVEYSADFAKLQQTVEDQADALASLRAAVEEQNETFGGYLDGLCERFDSDEESLSALLQENQMIMKELSRQLDVLTELVGEMSAKLDRRDDV